MSYLPRRTMQAAIDNLKHQCLVIERNSLDDTRKKVYQSIQLDWL
jgi:phosphosulfolactate synthase